MNLFSKYFMGVAIALYLPLAAYAQETPNHSYQIVENLNRELDVLMDADFIDPSTISAPMQVHNLKPTHVVNRTRVIMIKLNTLRWIAGMDERSIPTVPVKNITPGDVKTYAISALEMAKELREKYELTTPQPADLPSGKTPTDVFNHLSLAMQKIFALNVPSIVPNEVYNQAEAVYSDVQMILRAKNIDKNPPFVASIGKKPKDGYEHAKLLIGAIAGLDPANKKTMSEINDMYTSNQPIGPTEVQNILGSVLAELLSLKFSLGITTPAIAPQPVVGKTPNDVYALLDQALRGLEMAQ